MRTLLFVLLVLFASCANKVKKDAMLEWHKPENNNKNMAAILEQTKDSLLVDSIQKAISYLGESSVYLKSYNDILKKFEESKALDPVYGKMNYLTVTVKSRTIANYDYDSFVTLNYTVKNNTGIPIKGYKGALLVKDGFGERIANLEVLSEETLEPNEESKEKWTFEHNEFIDWHNDLKYKDFDKMTFVFTPSIILE